MKLGVLSDTHGLLRQEVLNHLQGCDAILHGGDINNQGILNTLSSVAPLYVVRGNNDKEWATELPLFINEEIAGIHVYMTHKKKGLPADLNPFDLVIVGLRRVSAFALRVGGVVEAVNEILDTVES